MGDGRPRDRGAGHGHGRGRRRPLATAPAAVRSTACPTGWGSLDESRATGTTVPVRNVRTGRHACFDRLVVDVPGAKAGRLGHTVGYVDRLHQLGSGRPSRSAAAPSWRSA